MFSQVFFQSGRDFQNKVDKTFVASGKSNEQATDKTHFGTKTDHLEAFGTLSCAKLWCFGRKKENEQKLADKQPNIPCPH